jgi:hypothetical protein
MKTIKARASVLTMAGKITFPSFERDEAAAENEGHNDKLEFKYDALASVNCNSQCLQGKQHVE